jgi:hypothetical protein
MWKPNGQRAVRDCDGEQQPRANKLPLSPLQDIWVTFNALGAKEHLLRKCNKVPDDVQELCFGGTQAAKKTRKLDRQASTANGGSNASESSATLEAAHATAASAQSSRRMIHQTTMTIHQTQMTTHFGRGLTRSDFARIIRLQVEALLKCFEPLSCLHDEFVQEALAAAVGNRNVLNNQILMTTATLYKNYVVPIDHETTGLDQGNTLENSRKCNIGC